jgi:hypothetical protein
VHVQPLVQPVRLLLENRNLWLPCNREMIIEGLPIPCLDGIWLLIIIRWVRQTTATGFCSARSSSLCAYLGTCSAHYAY